MGDIFDTLITGGLAFLSDREETERRRADANAAATAAQSAFDSQQQTLALIVGAGVLIFGMWAFTR